MYTCVDRQNGVQAFKQARCYLWKSGMYDNRILQVREVGSYGQLLLSLEGDVEMVQSNMQSEWEVVTYRDIRASNQEVSQFVVAVVQLQKQEQFQLVGYPAAAILDIGRLLSGLSRELSQRRVASGLLHVQPLQHHCQGKFL